MAALNVGRAKRAKPPPHNGAYNAPYEDPITDFVRQNSSGSAFSREAGFASM
jgi:hypothetical protein